MLGFAEITCIFSRLQTNIISLFSKIVNLLTLQCSTKGEYILEELHVEMVLAMHIQESSQSAMEKDNFVSSGDATQRLDNKHHNENQDYNYFIGKVIHPFDAQADGELSLNVDEYVVVRKVSPEWVV